MSGEIMNNFNLLPIYDSTVSTTNLTDLGASCIVADMPNHK